MSDSATLRYGLVGRRLGHSFSRDFFAKLFADGHINARYDNYELDSISRLPQLIADTPALGGLNVTIPYKQSVIDFLSELSPDARDIGAVNTIVVDRRKGCIRLTGHNTDAVGFRNTLLPLLYPGIVSALVLGSGGASKAVVHVLRSIGIEPLVVSRSEGTSIRYDELSPAIVAEHKLIVNATPLGMWPDADSYPAIPYDAVTPSHVCYDLVYNPSPTLFMRRCAARGATTIDGLPMLHAQALAAWRLWSDPSSRH